MNTSNGNNGQQRSGTSTGRPTVWHIGGDDVHLRIPLLRRLREKGFDVGAVGSEDSEPFRQHDIPYWYYPLKRFISPWSDRVARARLYELFSHHRPDIVHAFDIKPTLFTPEAAQRARLRGCVRTITGMGYVFSSSSLLALALRPGICHLHKKASHAASMTIFQNPDDQAFFRRKGLVPTGRDTLVLGSGLDVDELLRDCPDDESLAELRNRLGLNGHVVVTMISRLVRHKGVVEYLQAARAIRQRNQNVHFLLVGPLASEGRQAVSRSEISRFSDDVSYLGPRNDVPALLAISDLFVLPSYYREGIPRVLLEAGAMGLPLITTDMPGCREAVLHGTNGRLVPPRDVDSLVKAIDQLLHSQPLRKSMGGISRRRVRDHFGLTSVADAYAKIYRQVLEQPPCRSDQKESLPQ